MTDIAKAAVGTVLAILTFVSYAPYVRDTVRGVTTPHVYTWLVWGLVSAIACGLQVSDGAGVGALGTLSMALVCLSISVLSLRQRERNIVGSDAVFLVMSLVALVLWVFAKQPVVSVIIVSATCMLGFVPTIRKSWNKPHQETLSTYAASTILNGLGLVALQHLTLVTALYLVTCLFANSAFSVLLIARRRGRPALGDVRGLGTMVAT